MEYLLCNGMFKLSTNKENSFAYIIDCSTSLWHRRLTHLNFRSLKYMFKHSLISYYDKIVNKRDICIQAKFTKKPFPKAERNTQILQLIHYDICEFNHILTSRGKIYFITFIEDFFRYTYVYLMSNKDESFDFFKYVVAEVEN